MIRYRYEQQVAALLLKEECVVIPKVGGLMVSSTPARILEEENTIIPPGKTLSFNQRINDEKHRLAKEVAKFYDLEEEIAITLINSESKNLLYQLEQNRSVIINGVGKFDLNEEGNIVFTDCPPQESLISPELGLSRVDLPTAVLRLNNKAQESYQGSSKNKNWMKVAASLALPLVAALGFMAQNSNGGINLSELGSFNSKQIEYRSRGYQPTILSVNHSFAQDASIAGEGITVLELNESVVPVALPEKESAISYKYLLIGGCFQDIANANKAVKRFQAKGYDAFIAEYKHKLYRVAIGKFSNKTEVKAGIKAAEKDLGIKPWYVTI